ncbi:MAG TPA: hypothetical protein VFB65_04310 [Pyrinomonadaceae bacterium]|nr:hypothetical protein [Pyrinomonadaceae bacterium]
MNLRPSVTALGVSLALLVAMCSLLAFGQSGRRQAKPPVVAPIPSPTPEPTPEPKTKKDVNEIAFLIGMGDRGGNFSRYPFTYVEAAARGCAERLRKGSSANVEVSQSEMTRGEAIAKAKSEQNAYVVLINLIEDAMSRSDSSGYVEIQVDYVVFAPGTAKVLTTGRTYENSARRGPVVVPRTPGGTLPTYREQSLRRAGEDAGERILKALHLNSQPPVK